MYRDDAFELYDCEKHVMRVSTPRLNLLIEELTDLFNERHLIRYIYAFLYQDKIFSFPRTIPTSTSPMDKLSISSPVKTSADPADPHAEIVRVLPKGNISEVLFELDKDDKLQLIAEKMFKQFDEYQMSNCLNISSHQVMLINNKIVHQANPLVASYYDVLYVLSDNCWRLRITYDTGAYDFTTYVVYDAVYSTFIELECALHEIMHDVNDFVKRCGRKIEFEDRLCFGEMTPLDVVITDDDLDDSDNEI
jgi:hypothetical protein